MKCVLVRRLVFIIILSYEIFLRHTIYNTILSILFLYLFENYQVWFFLT